jgi:hypothetical protein
VHIKKGQKQAKSPPNINLSSVVRMPKILVPGAFFLGASLIWAVLREAMSCSLTLTGISKPLALLIILPVLLIFPIGQNIHEYLHQKAYFLCTGKKGVVRKRLHGLLAYAFYAEEELSAPIFRLVSLASILGLLPFCATVAIAAFFSAPKWITGILLASGVVYLMGTTQDLYWFWRLRTYDHEWLISDRGDYLILRLKK